MSLSRFLPILSLLLLPAAAGAQVALLVRDINTTGDVFARSGQPDLFVRFRDKALFRAASDASHGPWTTDGTAAGTELLADISNVGMLGPLGGAFIVASVVPGGLWRTDATRAGTVRLTPPELTVGNTFAQAEDRLFFAGCTPYLGCEPWVTDGTPAGTRLIRDIVPGADGSDPRDFERLGDEVYFFTGPSSPVELWVSDGAAGDTRRAAQLIGASARLLTATEDRLFFVLNRSGGQEIWTSDGSQAGTLSLARFIVTPFFVPTNWLKPIGDRIFFVAQDEHGTELWTSDGTVAGTRRVTDFTAELAFGSLYAHPDQLQVFNGLLLFAAGGGNQKTYHARSG